MTISFVWLYMFKCDLCILNFLIIKPKNIFEYFICFWKCFCVPLVFWDFFQKAKSILLKNSSSGIFASKSQKKLSCSLTTKMRKLISISSKILHREFPDSLASASWETTSRETCPVHLRHSTSILRVLHEKLSREMSGFSVFKRTKSDRFSKISFCLLHASFNPKHISHSNLNQNSKDFNSKSYLGMV